MSGVAALFNRDGRPAEPDQLQAMLSAVPYRGPDGMKALLLGPLALGHAKMAMTDEEEQHEQPLVSPRTGCAITADVRLDNRDELMTSLPDRPPRTVSDAELILRSYESWGVDAIERFLGDFSFVLWDPAHQCLVCARDTSGQRTLYYRTDGLTFVAASEIHQLLQDPRVAVEPNEERIRDALVPYNMSRNEKDMPSTYYKGIFGLPAAHVLTVDEAGVRLRRYWELEPKTLRYRTTQAYVDHFRALFLEVIRTRLRTSRPLGVLLSGGLDSSSIVCTAQHLYGTGDVQNNGLTTYSVTFDGLDCDEHGLIADAQAMYGFEARYFTCGDYQGRLELEPEGFLDGPKLGVDEASDAILRAVQQGGVRALLTGDVADSCVRGSRYVFDSLLRQGDLGAFARHMRAYRRASHDSLHKLLTLYCMVPLLPLVAQHRVLGRYAHRAWHRERSWLLPEWMPSPLQADLLERELRLRLETARGRRFSSPAREAEYELLYPPEMVRHPVPWPVEIWRPYADRRLHAFLLAVPPEQKFEPHPQTDAFYAGSKQLVRRGLAGILPESVRTRTHKTIFGAVVTNEIDRQWSTYEAAFGPNGRSEVAERGYIERDAFWSRLQALRAGGSGSDLIYTLYITGLETWLRTFSQPRSKLVAARSPWRQRPPGGAPYEKAAVTVHA